MKFEKAVEEFFKAPAVALGEGVEAAKSLEGEFLSKTPLHAAEEYLNTLGPGLTTGAADDDPSGIATYSQAGAQYGFQLLWLALFTFPLMSVAQEMCARIGLVTGKGLAANIRTHYPRWALYGATGLLFFANTLNLGADLGAMAKAAQLMIPGLDFTFALMAFAITILLLQIYTTYARYAKYLKYLTLVLFSYVATALLIPIDWHQVLMSTIVPSITFSSEQILLICAILGTTISPYLFFWQTSQEVEEQVLKGYTTVSARKHEVTQDEISRMRTDTWSGMFFSNAIMFFIIAACAATLAANGITDIKTADEAALALRPFAGEWAFFLFALGIIGTGLLAVPILAGSASYAISESFGWRTGLYRKLNEAYAFYGVIIVAMLLGIGFNFVGIDPMKALIYSAIANGLIAPVVLYFIVSVSSDKKIMGHFTNNALTRWIGWATVAVMGVVGAAAIVVLL